MSESRNVIDDPSSGWNNVALLLAAFLMFGLCFTIVGIVPVAILVMGFAIAYRTGNVATVRITTRLIQLCLVIGAVVSAYFAIEAQNNMSERSEPAPEYHEMVRSDDYRLNTYQLINKYGDDGIRIMGAQSSIENAENMRQSSVRDFERWRNDYAGGVAVLIVGVLSLTFLWMRPAIRFISNRHGGKEKAAKVAPQPIMGRESMASYSVADELRKWSDLRKDGAIGEDEYNEVRQRLLNSR
jgi:hypothetical protein